MKKAIKFLFAAAVVFIVFCAASIIVLKKMYPQSKIKLMAQNYVRENLKREVDFSSVSLNFGGVTVKDFKLSERSTFEQGTFVQAKKAVVKLELLPLIQKRISISTLGFDGLKINVIKNKDGKFNFDDFLSAGPAAAQKAEETQNDDSAPLNLVADNIYLKNASVFYTDNMSGNSFGIKQVNVEVSNFDFEKDFNFSASLITDVKTPSLTLPGVKLSLVGNANLAQMQLADASLQIKKFATQYKTASLEMSGSVNNFENPQAVLSGSIQGIGSNLLSEFIKNSAALFSLPQVNIEANTSTDISGGTTKINNIKISLGNSYVVTEGNLDYSSPDFKYTAATRISVSLAELGQIASDMLGKYALTGTLSGTADIASAKSGPLVKSVINFNGVGANVDGKELKNVNGTITVASLNDIKTNLITGFFTGSAFRTSLAYAKAGGVNNINFLFDLDKFTLDDVNFDSLMSSSDKKSAKSKKADKEEQSSAQPASSADVKPQRSEAFNIKADVFIRKIANNIFNNDNLVLKADIKNFDNIMDRAYGTISFSGENGEIKDIDKLMSSSVVARVLFSSVRIVQKALNFIKMDKLSIGMDTITYKTITGDYTLNNGILTINKSDIDSDLTTVKALGNINLVNEKLDMKIESHLGKVTSSGFKPVVIKVGGTLSNPIYKLDVVSTVTSVVNLPGSIVKGGVGVSTGIVKGVASGTGEIIKGTATGTADIVKGVAGSIGSLFKKDKKQEEGGK